MSSKLVIGNVNLFPYTGSAEIEGDLTVTGLLSGTTVSGTFWGDGSNLTGVGGGGGTPGGADTQVQYNDAGSFAGSANFIFDGSAVSVTGSVALSGSGDNIVITSNSEAGVEIGPAHLGNWPAVSNYAFFGHNSLDQSVAGNYGFMQSAAGETFFNAAAGQQLNFRINNSNKLNILSDGKVGIGVAASALALLHISGSDGTDAFRIDTQGATDNPAIFVSGSNSYVGIGTDEPSQGLHVKDNGGGQIVSRIEGIAGRAVLQVDNGTNYTFFGASTSGLDFSVGGAGDFGAQQMVLSATGRLGINVTDPDSQLEVSSSTTQQKWSYDADSYVTMTVADDSHATIASGESGDITIDAATLYVTGSTQHLGGVNGQEVSLGAVADGGTVDWDASLGEYAHVLAAGSLDVKIINMSASMTLNLIIENDTMPPGSYDITLSGSTDGTGTNGTSAKYANGVTSLLMVDSDNYLSVELASFSVGLFQIGNNFYS